MNSNNANWEKLSIGSDESGKGDFFGALSIVAVKLDEPTLKKLKQTAFFKKIKDSKACTEEWIKEVAPQIMKLCEYSYIDLTIEEYNQLYAKYSNLNILIAFLHNKVHSEIKGDEFRVIDAFTNEKLYYEYLKKINEQPVTIDLFCTKAESYYLSVALASIIARYLFILKMESISQKTGVAIPYGNSYYRPNSVIDAYLALKKAGYKDEEICTKLVKNHFSTLKKIKQL
ncbi:ribonuclease HIII [Candidatus Mycoplasma haematohominis]|uniref:ribonuclease HIII n=1 Tax=Candidatus Mycoplasma haematohominis TaxID=1494318 RepID=UPI001C0A7413|nr:ribonuclease HIII [Candidatus Mycoplasma haemohominis]